MEPTPETQQANERPNQKTESPVPDSVQQRRRCGTPTLCLLQIQGLSRIISRRPVAREAITTNLWPVWIKTSRVRLASSGDSPISDCLTFLPIRSEPGCALTAARKTITPRHSHLM